jgi:hypothetical protein
MPKMYTLSEWPFSRSWQEWTTRWWRWFLTTPREIHPAYDCSGEHSVMNQKEEKVFFLAGTTGGRAERAITIPSGKAVLFPVINFVTSYSENPTLKTEAEMISYAKSNIDDITKKEVNMNGISMPVSEEQRVQSPPFDFSFPTNNIYGVKAGQTRGAGDGYWIFLRPLPVGRHIIRTFGSCLSGKIQIDVNIQLLVKD